MMKLPNSSRNNLVKRIGPAGKKISEPAFQIPIGVFSSGFAIPKNDFNWNLTYLSQLDFQNAEKSKKGRARFLVHPQVYRRELFFSGSDEERATGFWELAQSNATNILWSARGGYGSLRILEYLDRFDKERRKSGKPMPKKLLVGFSDITVLQSFVTDRWGWGVLHAPMLGARDLTVKKRCDWSRLLSVIAEWDRVHSWKGISTEALKTDRLKLKPLYLPTGFRSIEGRLIGGNLASWVSVLGGPFHPKTDGAILFFEDVGEDLYRIDRLLQQVRHLGGLKGVQGIVLGDFTNCQDHPAKTLTVFPGKISEKRRQQMLTSPRPRDLKPIRPTLKSRQAIPLLFKQLAMKENIPLVMGVPSGHDPKRNEPLVLNELFSLGFEANTSRGDSAKPVRSILLRRL